MEETPKDNIKFLVGDWNAKIGTDRESYEDMMGKYRIGNRNERGEMLLEFAKRKKLCVANTLFQGRPKKKWTWTSPNGVDKNMIDFPMVEQKWKSSVKGCRSFPSADIDSDHQLVLCKFHMKLTQVKKA